MALTNEQRSWLAARLKEERARLVRELAEIDYAGRLLEAEPERFGFDELTGEEIPFEQLMDIPWVRTVRPHVGSTEIPGTDSDVLAANRNERYSG